MMLCRVFESAGRADLQVFETLSEIFEQADPLDIVPVGRCYNRRI